MLLHTIALFHPNNCQTYMQYLLILLIESTNILALQHFTHFPLASVYVEHSRLSSPPPPLSLSISIFNSNNNKNQNRTIECYFCVFHLDLLRISLLYQRISHSIMLYKCLAVNMIRFYMRSPLFALCTHGLGHGPTDM